MNFKIITITILTFIFQSCGRTFNLDIDSLSSPQCIENKTYILVSEENKNDLQFQEFSCYTEKVFEDLGYVKVLDPLEANIIVSLSYGISEPNFYEYTYTTPIYGQTGIASSNTYGNINTYCNGASYTQTTTYTPQYGIVGSQLNKGIGVSYFRHLRLVGYDVNTVGLTVEPKEIWKTTVTSTGPSGDLREVFPYLLIGAKKYVGTSTGKKISLVMYENDKEVRKLLSNGLQGN